MTLEVKRAYRMFMLTSSAVLAASDGRLRYHHNYKQIINPHYYKLYVDTTVICYIPSAN